LWRSTLIVKLMKASDRVYHGQDIRDYVFDFVEGLAVDIRLANQ